MCLFTRRHISFLLNFNFIISTQHQGEATKRAKKDKNAPKRGMSAYMLFFNENRQKILTENPGIAFVDVSKKASEMWKAQTDKTVSIDSCMS